MESKKLTFGPSHYGSGQTPKVKGLQSAYMIALFGTFGTKSLTSQQKFESSKNENPNSSRSRGETFFQLNTQKLTKGTHNIQSNPGINLGKSFDSCSDRSISPFTSREEFGR